MIEPWGEERADLRSAIIATVFANAHRGKNQPAFVVADFMPRFHTTDGPHEAAQQTDDEILATLERRFPRPQATTEGKPDG